MAIITAADFPKHVLMAFDTPHGWLGASRSRQDRARVALCSSSRGHRPGRDASENIPFVLRSTVVKSLARRVRWSSHARNAIHTQQVSRTDLVRGKISLGQGLIRQGRDLQSMPRRRLIAQSIAQRFDVCVYH